MSNRNYKTGQTREDIQRVRDELIKVFTKPGDVEGVDYFDKVIHFDNDDVPKYLAHLKRLKERPSKILATTGVAA